VSGITQDQAQIEWPSLYTVNDLPLVKTFSYEKPMSDFDLEMVMMDHSLMKDFFQTLDLSSISNSIGQDALFVYDLDALDRILSSKPVNITKLFIGLGTYQLSSQQKLAIKGFVSSYNINVSIVKLNLMTVATQGQYFYGASSKNILPNTWNVLIAAQNHDLYQKHIEHSYSLKMAFLVVPGTVKKLDRLLTNGIASQLAEESRRFNEYYADCQLYIRNSKSMGITFHAPLKHGLHALSEVSI
jgi:hypothetical protein